MARPPDAVDGRALLDSAMSEKDWQNEVIEVARAQGWHVWFTWGSKHSPFGELDLRLVRPPRYLLAECKSERGKISGHQAEAIELLRQCPGVEVYVWRPSDWHEVLEVLE